MLGIHGWTLSKQSIYPHHRSWVTLMFGLDPLSRTVSNALKLLFPIISIGELVQSRMSTFGKIDGFLNTLSTNRPPFLWLGETLLISMVFRSKATWWGGEPMMEMLIFGQPVWSSISGLAFSNKVASSLPPPVGPGRLLCVGRWKPWSLLGLIDISIENGWFPWMEVSLKYLA